MRLVKRWEGVTNDGVHTKPPGLFKIKPFNPDGLGFVVRLGSRWIRVAARCISIDYIRSYHTPHSA
jgi:hypothetical protein